MSENRFWKGSSARPALELLPDELSATSKRGQCITLLDVTQLPVVITSNRSTLQNSAAECCPRL
jgi:hypothetical protein